MFTLILFPVFFLAILCLIFTGFSESIQNTIDDSVGNMTADIDYVTDPPFPTWNSTYANHQMEIIPSFTLWNFSINGGFFSGGSTVNWTAQTPAFNVNDGWLVFAGDNLNVGNQILQHIADFAFRVVVLIVMCLTPPEDVASVSNLIWIIYLAVYTMFGIGMFMFIKEYLDTIIELIGAIIPF